MCLYENEIINPATIPSLKKGKERPGGSRRDTRHNTIRIPCGICEECVRKKRNEWKIRITEELKHTELNAYMVTLTVSEQALKEIETEIPGITKNAEKTAKILVKRFRERWRKEFGKSIKHFLVSELGHNNTERLHMHGVLITDKNLREGHINDNKQNRITRSKGRKTGIMSTTCLLAKKWKYGQIHIGEYCNESTVGYIVKYITKTDTKHEGFKPKILTSPGMGAKYTENNKEKHKFNWETTDTKYTTNTGVKVELPMYYKRKIWNSNERENLWSMALDRNTIWINGHEINKSKSEEIRKAVKFGHIQNKLKGYPHGWERNEKKIWPTHLKF